MKKPLVSVVIPVYNGARFIAAAVESVFAQTYAPVEVIVVNDGSTDTTAEVLATFGEKIHVITQENRGQAIARNVGLRAARGTIIGLLDADDLWPVDHITLMLPYLEQGYDFVRGQTRYVKDLGTGIEEMTRCMFMYALIGACLYTRDVFDRVGLFDEEMRHGEDLDWNIRLEEHGCKEKRIDEAMLLYRRHDQNLTLSQDFVKNGQVLAFRKRLARARAAGRI